MDYWNSEWPPKLLGSGIGPVSGAGGATVGGGPVGLGCILPASQAAFDELSGWGGRGDPSVACQLSFDDGHSWNEFRLALFRVLHTALPHDVRFFQLAHRG